jgi:serine/threonine-protein kinase
MSLSQRRIGPYRLEERLGAGGMGEVYRAWDDRLGRAVAVKLIRPESSEDAEARERFRREARSAAALSHPAVVQIYDVVGWGNSEAIVMELVEGVPLSRRIAAGPLPVGLAVGLAGEIAEGLAAAHARGILHRDLKPENIRLTPEGHAKILDFGLARRADDPALTRSNVLIGTFRSMSPEQARGLPLDPRSDLFSFGILLYEMLTGRSPFQGAATLDTLERICSARQTPVRELRPEVPEALSRLVDLLLEKDPALRPGSAREVAAALERLAGEGSSGAADRGDSETTWLDGARPAGARAGAAAEPARSAGPSYRPLSRRRVAVVGGLALLAAVALALVLADFGRRGPVYVAVLAPQAGQGGEDRGRGWMAAGLREALLRELAALDGVSPLTPEQVDPVPGSPMEVARAVAAEEVITSAIDCRADLCRVSLGRSLGKDGRSLWTRGFEVPADRPHLLVEAVRAHVREAYPDHRSLPGTARFEVSPEDYRRYLELLASHRSQRGTMPMDVVLAELAAIRRRSPRFLDALLFESSLLRLRFTSGRDPADLERAFDLLRQARSLAPADPRPPSILFEVALTGERLGLAEEALADLERLEPGDPAVDVARAQLLERRGKTAEALALMRQAVERRPSWYRLYRLAQLEYRLGEAAAARDHLEDLLIIFPGYFAAQSMLAQIELLSGDPRRAAELYTDLVRRSPQFPELVNLGLAQLLLGRYAEAEKRLRQAARLEADSSLVLLNLADAVLLQRRRGEAEAIYRHVLELTGRDPAAGSWQVLSMRAQALAHLGRRREAAEHAQRALLAAAGNPQAAYEVALVYTLVGDQASALANAERALEQGVEPVWFRAPWFAPLRRDPEFRAALARASTASADRAPG